MTGHPEWAEDASLFSERGALAGAIDEWVGAQAAHDVLELASAFRIPNAPIVDGENARTIEHLRQRGSFGGGDDRPVGPRSPLRLTGAPAPDRPAPPRAGTAPGLPFAGLRILDMTAYWAGPSATHIFALLGAEVIHLESGRRPDGARSVGVSPRTDAPAWERGPIFTALNTNKKSLTLDFGTPEGLDLLRRFVATCDVVVESFTPRVLDQLGLDDHGLRALRPDLIVVRMPGFGLTGPWRDNAAFAFVIEDASGLTWLTGHPDAHPVEPYCIGDSNAGLHGALGLLVALAHRDATGAGCHVEAAMIDAALSITAEQVVEHSACGVRLERAGNRGPAAAPQDLYDCGDPSDDRDEPARVAIAVATDEQWAGLRRALGDPPWAADPALATHAGRDAARDLIDGHLRPWCATRAADEIVATLWDAGVPVAKVLQPHEQPDLPPLAARRFFEEVYHPVSGPARCSTLPFRLPGQPGPLHARPAPLLGEHTDELLRELGLDDEQLAALAAAGVTATAPVGAG
jgi:crotonobetainyl-CoA:carnitine CoA-transferase CaiB-like acyl-CoA transferase